MRLTHWFFCLAIICSQSLSAQIDSLPTLTEQDTLTVTETKPTNASISVGGGFEVDYLNPVEYTIGPISVEGAEGYDINAIRMVAGLRQGQKIVLPGQTIADAINNLWKEGLFSDVQIFAEKELAGVVYLVIQVKPRPKLSKYRFTGINKRQADKIREQIDLFTGKTISENLVYKTKAKINGYFREEGYFAAKIDIQRVPDEIMYNSEVFLININRGKKVKIKEIQFSGVESVKEGKLKRAMKDTKEQKIWRFFKASKFTESAFDRDKDAMLSKFNAVGLRDAKLVKDTFYMISDRHLKIELTVDEGEKYYFGELSWIGNTKYRSTYLDTILGIKSGDIFNKELLEERLRSSQDGRNIASLYMDRGYLFFDVQEVETDFTDNRISYEFRIREGKEARVGTITIKGNTKTNDHVILREIRTRPGDLFSRNDIIRTQRELAQLGYFNEQGFQVNPMPDPQKGTVDIEYVVEEKSSDQIELSGGYGGNLYGRPMIMGTVGLTFNNFSAKNFFKKGSWSPLPSGDGQRLSIRGQTSGRYFQSFNLSFTEPWLGGKKPNSLTAFMSHQMMGNGLPRNDVKSGQLNITGLGVVFGRRLKFPDDYFNESYELSYQYYSSNNYVTSFFPYFENGYANDISLKYTIQRSSISSPIYPQYGTLITLSGKSTLPYSAFTGRDYSNDSQQERMKYLEYFKIKFGAEWFVPLSRDQKLVLRTRVGMGYMGYYNAGKGLSPFDRFFLGGSGLTGMGMMIGGREVIALRGYDDNTMSSNGGDPIAAKMTMELRYPISLNPSATFYVLAFAEAGNSYPNFRQFNPLDVKRSVGAGIRIFLPMFGMLGIDYGWGFDQLSPWASGFGGASDISIREKGYNGKLTFTIGMNLGDL